jgi:hypothetical protein
MRPQLVDSRWGLVALDLIRTSLSRVMPASDADEPQQFLAKAADQSTVISEGELSCELFLDRAEIVSREPRSDVVLLCLELADLPLELLCLQASVKRKISSHARAPHQHQERALTRLE